MLRWNPAEAVSYREIGREALPIPTRESASQDNQASAVQYLLDAVLDTVSRLGLRTLVLTAVLLVIVAALALGLTVQDASAGLRWCPQC
jgi:hypothetical protein